MNAPPISSVISVAVKLGMPTAKELFSQRKIASGANADQDMVGALIDRTLDMLSGRSSSLLGNITVAFKNLAANTPPEFKSQHIQEWINNPTTRPHLRAEVLDIISGRKHGQNRNSAVAILHNDYGEEILKAEGITDLTLSIIAIALISHISIEGKLLLDAISKGTDEIEDTLTQLTEGQEGLAISQAIMAQGVDDLLQRASEAVPSDVIDKHVAAQLRSAQIRSWFAEAGTLTDLEAVALRVDGGNLKSASLTLRVSIFKELALVHACTKDFQKAEEWLKKASTLDPEVDLNTDYARIKNLQNLPSEALKILKGKTDPFSLGLMIEAVFKKDGLPAALETLVDIGGPQAISAVSLLRFAFRLAEASDFVNAEKILCAATPEQISHCPAILTSRAMSRLVLCGFNGGIEGLTLEPPVHPSKVQFSDAPDKVELRNKALADIVDFLYRIRDLNLPNIQSKNEFIASWLKLCHSEKSVRDSERLRLEEGSKNERNFALKHIVLTLDYGISVDIEALETYLAVQKRFGDWSQHECIAALAIAIDSYDPTNKLNFLRANRALLEKELSPKFLWAVEVEVLSKSWGRKEAQEVVDLLTEKFEEEFIFHLKNIIEFSCGDNPIDAAIAIFDKFPTDSNRRILSEVLIERGLFLEATPHLTHLFNKAPTSSDAATILNCMLEGNYLKDASEFLSRSDVSSLVNGSDRLKALQAWSKFLNGDVYTASQILKGLDISNKHIRRLALFVAIESGDWEELSVIMDSDFANKESMSSEELIGAAQIGYVIKHPRTEQLLDAAVKKAEEENNASVMSTAYGTAVKLGLDNKRAEIHTWLQKAIALSGSDGPVRQYEIKEVITLVEKERKHQSFVNDLVNEGTVPLSVAAGPLRISLTEIIIGNFVRNNEEKDFRYKYSIPLFAGNHEIADLSGISRVAIDRTAILTLGYLGLLDKVINHFDMVIIPRLAMEEIFSDLGEIRYHQPSRVRAAESIKSYVASKRLEVVYGNAKGDADYSIGDELQRLAFSAISNEGLVVAVPPIYKAGSNLSELADTSLFERTLIGPHEVLNFLVLEGEIGSDDAEAIRAEFLGGIPTWTHSVDIVKGQPLYLDDHVLDILDRSGLIDALKSVFPKIFIDRSTLENASALSAYSKRQEAIEEVIQKVRSDITSGFNKGRVVLSPSPKSTKQRSNGKALSIENLLTDPGDAEVAVIDDRAVNKLPVMTTESGSRLPVTSSLSLIRELVSRAAISRKDHHRILKKLKMAGASYVPADAEEISDAIAQGNPSRAISFDMRLILDYLDFVNIKNFISHADENILVVRSLMEFMNAIRLIWKTSETSEIARASCSAILSNMPDPYRWLSQKGDITSPEWARRLRAMTLVILANGVALDNDERLPDYLKWYEDAVIPILTNGDQKLVQEAANYMFELLTKHIDEPLFGDAANE